MNLNELLNPEQQDAVETTEGPLLVLAGAGSGKTRVVTYRVAYLLQQGIPASKILGLTFTNKAANEMKERIHHLTSNDVLICTFHSIGARILRESIHHLGYERNFTIYDENDADQLLKACLKEVTGLDGKQELKELKYYVSRKKNSPDEFEDSENPAFSSVYKQYKIKMRECNAVDYDDLLALPVRLFKEHPHVLEWYQDRWSHLLIDEYQDTNALQYSMVNSLVAKSRNVCVVGDPDQSIYSWRGANIRNIMDFERDYPGTKVVRLDQNYRSRSNILDAANALISHNENRYEKHLWSGRGPGEKIKLYRADNEKDESAFVARQIATYHDQLGIPYNQMVIFYRTNAQSRPFEDNLLMRRIPYAIVGGLSFYQRREIKDILAWMRMIISENDLVAFLRTINLPKRGLGDATLEKLRIGAAQAQMPILQYCQKVVRGEGSLKLTARQKEGLQDYLGIVSALRELSPSVSIANLVTAAIDKTNYWAYLAEDKETLIDRKENLNALVSKAMEWEQTAGDPTLTNFLEELSLKSSLDEAESQNDRVSVMTIHNGKGLEFTLTFLVGLEEDLFPHINAKQNRDDPSSIEEERRLCYVGMTRAKEYLYLTYAVMRTIWGVTRGQYPSRFLREVPLQYVEKLNRG